MLKNIFIALYIMMALSTAGLTMSDYVDCYVVEHPNRSMPGGVRTGLEGVFSGVFWPIVLPGMIAVYDNHEGRFCS